MQGYIFKLGAVDLTARQSGALWWEERRTLCVADLHLGKSERFARRGGVLLPPYESRETLDRLAAEIEVLNPRCVLCLGDSFDDDAAAEGLGWPERDRLFSLAAGRRWIWVAGNHDPGPVMLAGETFGEYKLGGLVFRHEARSGAEAEISGHWHPKISVTLRARRITRPCFLIDGNRVILPAFGAYTGGLSARHPQLRQLMRPSARAVLTGRVSLSVAIEAEEVG